MNNDPSNLYFHLYTLVNGVAHGLVRIREDELRHSGSDTSRRVAILLVAQILGREATPAKIARNIFREPHSVSIITDKMEKDGLVKKVHDLVRKNQVRIEITEKGFMALSKIPERKALQRTLSCLSKEELKQLASLMERIWDKALKEMGMDPQPPFPMPSPVAKNNIKQIVDPVPVSRRQKLVRKKKL